MSSIFLTLVAVLHLVDSATLEDVYGKVTLRNETVPFNKRPNYSASNANKHTPEWYEMRRPENCQFPIEIVFVQDTSYSFQKSLMEMIDVQLPKALPHLKKYHPNTRFGVTSFRDKPVEPFGWENDYCVRFDQSLTTEDADIFAAFRRLKSSGGSDTFENQLGAIHSTLQSDTPGWSPLATRLLVVSTDASPHFAGDGDIRRGKFRHFEGTFDEDNAEKQCVEEYYPSLDHVAKAVIDREAYVAFIIADGLEPRGVPMKSWQYINAYIGQEKGFVGRLGKNSDGFWSSLADIIHHLEETECIDYPEEHETSTTTEDETTEAPVETTETTEAPVETTETTQAPVETTETTDVPVETTETIQTPMENSAEAAISSEVPDTSVGFDVTGPGSVEEPSCSEDGPCPCPEVEIVLRHRPKALKLAVTN